MRITVFRLLFFALVVAVFTLGAPVRALAGSAPSSPVVESSPTTPIESEAAEDVTPDPAPQYLATVRLVGGLTMAGGVGIMVGSILSAAVDVAVLGDSSRIGPYLVAVGVPAGSTLLLAGLPGVLVAPRFARWYESQGPAPSAVARWNLMLRWRAQLLQVQRDAGFIGAVVLAGAGSIAAVGWAVNDRRGVNGSGEYYDPADLVATVALGSAAVGAAVGGLIAGGKLRALQRSGSGGATAQRGIQDLRLLAGVGPALGSAQGPVRAGPLRPFAVHLGVHGLF